ncbi:hypothetical protein NZD88_06265 [Chryseobacterium antibioticum]|uniref:MoxR-vWA-beta-propeller ternary system domain-containing protein n=1 Tax=Chryseobacterium pyrolae TaxID=2987481 RepID=A0ABT2IEW4_9FLAO|nr:hypothetical protein [Chryseobacterium pyrolae]MCT2407144.1 hypothetical protein [Chryseobacterium pyrolae]
MMETRSPFLDTILLLRNSGSITVFSNLHEISKKEEQEAGDYFEAEFEKERLEFLSTDMNCDKEAAVWGAKILYYSAQLYLIRENTAKDLDKLIPKLKSSSDISSILSADLSLRFLPQIASVLQTADPYDPLVKILEEILTQFHYSGIGYPLNLEKVNWEKELQNKVYRKLYLERIVEKKAYALAEIPYINKLLMADFGLHKDIYWRDLKIVAHED